MRGELRQVPRALFTSYVVQAQVEGVDLTPFDLYTADRTDLSFRQRYPKEEWVTPSLMRFGRDYSRNLTRSRVRVINRSAQSAKMIRFDHLDLVLAFDVAPNSEVAFDIVVADPSVIQIHAVLDSGTLVSGSFQVASSVFQRDLTYEVNLDGVKQSWPR